MKRFSMLAGFALSIYSPPTEAATYIITYTGTVSSSNDIGGVFGLSGLNVYNGLNYTSVYTLTTPLPGTYVYNNGITTGTTYGGTDHGTLSPVSATFTLNGMTQSFTGEASGGAEQHNLAWSDRIRHSAADKIVVGINYRYNYIEDEIEGPGIVSSTDYTDLLDYVVQAGVNSRGNFQAWAKSSGSMYYDQLAYGTLKPASIKIELFSPAPEPETWMVMLVGFGAISSAMRRKQRQTTGIVSS